VAATLLRWTISDYHRMIAVGLLGDRHQPIAMFLMLQSPEVSALLSIVARSDTGFRSDAPGAGVGMMQATYFVWGAPEASLFFCLTIFSKL
jgi:hypothetical protein